MRTMPTWTTAEKEDEDVQLRVWRFEGGFAPAMFSLLLRRSVCIISSGGGGGRRTTVRDGRRQ